MIILRNNPNKSWHLSRWSWNSLSLWILNIHYHIHKPLSLGLKSNLIKLHLNTIIPGMLMSMN